MNKQFKKIVALTLCIALLLPVIASANATETTRAQARSARNALNTAGRNFNRQLDRIETLRFRQERAYARLVARQESAEARLIERQMRALSNAYARFDTPATGLQARLNAAQTGWNNHVAHLSAASHSAFGITTIPPLHVAWSPDPVVPEGATALRQGAWGRISVDTITPVTSRMSIDYANIVLEAVPASDTHIGRNTSRPANWGANPSWQNLLPVRRGAGFETNNPAPSPAPSPVPGNILLPAPR